MSEAEEAIYVCANEPSQRRAMIMRKTESYSVFVIGVPVKHQWYLARSNATALLARVFL